MQTRKDELSSNLPQVLTKSELKFHRAEITSRLRETYLDLWIFRTATCRLICMSTPKPRVTIEVTEKELAYLMRVIDYPYSNHPQLQSKLGDATQQMREAKRAYNRELKRLRTEKKQRASLTEEPYDGYVFGDD